MKLIKLSQGKQAIVDDDDFKSLNKFRWFAIRKRTYIYVERNAVTEGGRRIKILMHKNIMNTPIGMDTDHINHNGLDNRKSNLRICTSSQNCMNRKKQTNNKSGYTGVIERKNGWNVQLKLNGKFKYFGTYKTPQTAAKIYNFMAQKYFGEFARLNKI